MTNSDNARSYARRNAFAAAVQSLVNSYAKLEQRSYWRSPKLGGTFETSRVETSDWMAGFTMCCEGLDRRVENRIIDEVKALFPRLRIEVCRKTINHPRFVSFAF